MDRNMVQECTIDELKVKLGEGVDSAYAMDVPVLVTFDYEAAFEGDPAQVWIHKVVIGKDDVVLAGERTSLVFHAGCSVKEYLDTNQIDALEQKLLDLADLNKTQGAEA